MEYKDFYEELLEGGRYTKYNKELEKRVDFLNKFLSDKRESAPGTTHQEKNNWLWDNDPQYAKVANVLFQIRDKRPHPETLKSDFNIERYYIRFGDLPKGGKSYNFLYKHWEKGMSAYEAKWNTKYSKWELIQDGLNAEGMASLNELFGMMMEDDSKRPVYLLHGKEMKDVGNDGEPLLQPDNIKVLKQLEPDEYFCMEVGVNWYNEL
jgi:hypothetical protein